MSNQKSPLNVVTVPTPKVDPNLIRALEQNYKHLDKYSKMLVDNVINPQSRENFLDFITAIDPMYRPERFHALIASELDSVAKGETQRLIITAPPQHGKSRLSSETFPAFWMGRNPDSPVAITSYSADLAEDKGSKVRELVESPEYSLIFPEIKTKSDNRAVSMWKLDGYTAYCRSTGVGGGLTGMGFKLGIIDDPFKDAAEAGSVTIREKVWAWYKSTFLTRMWPGSAIVIIQTRWHEDDLIGRVLNSRGSNSWKIVRLPAISEDQYERDRNNAKYNLAPGLPDPLGREPNQALCPELRPLDFLIERRDNSETTSMEWAALYQGAPSAPDGNKIKRSWLEGEDRIIQYVPVGDHVRRVRYWDKASTSGVKNKRADYTVGVLMAYDMIEKVFYIEDVVRGQFGLDQRNQIIEETAMKDYLRYAHNVKQWFEQEPGSSGKESAEILLQKLVAFRAEAETSTGSKEVRGEPFANACSKGWVRIIKHDPLKNYGLDVKEINELIDELCQFPNGSHDDQWDACAGAFNKLAINQKKMKEMMIV